MTDVKFYYQRYKEGMYWGEKNHNMFYSNDIKNQCWLSDGVPCSGEHITLQEILNNVKPNVDKKKRDVVYRLNTTTFPIKEQCDISKWNGIIFVDIDDHPNDADLGKLKLHNFTEDQFIRFYDDLYFYLSDKCPTTFYYMERSSTGNGIHVMFYYDVERTEDNYHKAAQLTKQAFLNDEYFTSVIFEHNSIFDSIYDRPYQKCFITGKSAEFNNQCSGKIDINVLDNIEVKSKNYTEKHSTFKIKGNFISKKGEWTVDHNQRMYIYTALKRVTKNKEELDKYWSELCKHFTLYRDYTYKKFLNEFNYDNIDASTARVSILEKYGIKIDKSKIYLTLKDDEYLGNKLVDVLSNTHTGITLLQCPTGGGKTRAWTDYNKSLINDVLEANHKPILVIEPLNSIINTKYNESEVQIVTGSKQFRLSNGYSMYVTNYNKLLRKTNGRWVMREDIDEFLSHFDLIVIDESHVIIKDSFRCDVLLPFVESINKAAKRCRVILQTATPMDEDKIFGISNLIYVYKRQKKDIKYIFRKCEDNKFNMDQLVCLTKYYINQKRKVYIYWNNASLTQLKSFKSFYDRDRVAIYHKRNTGEESMEYISINHKLGEKYDVLLSSVYFGVGNDLDDECDAAVIIVGNNTWQEDIQAIGRWRNSNNIEVCQIILKNEYEYIKETKDNKLNYNELIKREKRTIENMWHDKLCKNKSVTINNKAWQINKESDIFPLAVMKVSESYYSSYTEKCSSLSDEYYGIRVKPDIDRPLQYNDDYTDALKEYWSGVKDERQRLKLDIINNKVDYEVINADSNLDKFKRLWNRLYHTPICTILSNDELIKTTNYNMLNIWCKYYVASEYDEIDYPELYALIWYYKQVECKKDEELNKEMEMSGVKLSYNDMLMICAYARYILNKNKDSEDYIIKGNYYTTFKWYCKLFKSMTDDMVKLLYEKSEPTKTATAEFFEIYSDSICNLYKVHNIDELVNQICFNKSNTAQISKVISKCLLQYTNGRAYAGSCSSPKKHIIVLEDMVKYNLVKGQMFESCAQLSEYANVRHETVTRWIKSHKINKLEE